MKTTNKFLGWEKPGTALVTGASAGMGLEFAGQLAQKGFDLVLAARRQDRLEKAAKKFTADHGVSCHILAADLSECAQIEKVADIIRHIGNLDILINNAGFATLGFFADVPIAKSLQMLHLHTQAAVRLSHAALEGMLQRKRGAIINVSSVAAFSLTPGNVMYDATKAFLATFSENLRLEVQNKGIRIQALCPGFTRTEFHEVGDFHNFDRRVIPDFLWMPADKVVSLSLSALNSNKTIFIPGWQNRLSTWLITHSSLFRKAVQNNVRNRAAY